MSTYVVFGDAGASKALVTAALNDYLETHIELFGEESEDFNIVLGPGKSKALPYVADWCEKAGVEPSLSDNLIEAVEQGYALDGDQAVVLALVGEDDPGVDVRRAIERAIDSHMVVRDLSEAGLTYILFSGDDVEHPPHLTEEEDMAEEAEEMTLSELVELADQGDAEADEALREAVADLLDDVDPDEYETWAEIQPLLEAALADGEEEEEEPEEDEETGGWTAESLKGLTLKEVREHAKAAGIENWKTATRPTLVKALIEGTSEEGEPEPEQEEKPAPKKPSKKAEPVSGDIDLDALADAIIDRLIARLS